MATFCMLILAVISVFLILVVLIQRGRGGGLAGAFGGMGGQSAFGTKAGDVFTRITIILVTVWVLLAGVSGILSRRSSERFKQAQAAETKPADDTKPESATATEPNKDAKSPLDDLKGLKLDDETEPSKPESKSTEQPPADGKQNTPEKSSTPEDKSESDSAEKKPASDNTDSNKPQ